jgi:hypothetical protein
VSPAEAQKSELLQLHADALLKTIKGELQHALPT